MANMPFKLSYNFEGNCQTRREQNLSGTTSKETRDLLLSRVHEERRKRFEQHLKLKNTIVIQSYLRSYVTRKEVKQQARLEFDEHELSYDRVQLLQRLLFFYDSKLDGARLVRTLERLLLDRIPILMRIDIDSRLCWLVKRTLCVCLGGLLQKQLSEISLKFISIFTQNTNSRAKLDILPYLVGKGYFNQLRKLLERCPDSELQTLTLIIRPFKSLSLLIKKSSRLILSEFCKHFLCSRITIKIKDVLIKHLQKHSCFPYSALIHFLNINRVFLDRNSLFYCVLALEPSDFEPTKESLQVLSWLSADVHQMHRAIEIDDSDDEEMEVATELVSLFDYIKLMNDARVKKIITFIEQQNDVVLLRAVIQLCHNLMIVCKDSNRKFMLIFGLALRGTFLSMVWRFIQKEQLPTTSTALGQWRTVHTCIAVFCDMFSFYTSTVTDTEASDTSGTFTFAELNSMSEIFKEMSLNLIELAFPMCRLSAIDASPELLHLYTSCLSCLKTLHMLDLRKNFCAPGFWTQKKIHISPDLVRKGYFLKTLKPFYGVVNGEDDEHLPPLSTIEQRSLAILQQLPFLVEFNLRVLLLRDLCRYSVSFDLRERSDFFLGESMVIIRRTHLYEDAFEKLSGESEYNFRRRFRIQFINTIGLEEVGIDGGGIFKEFVNDVLKTSFDPNRGFFLLTNDNMLYPNPDVEALVDNYAEHYYFIGRLVGKAIFDNVLVDLPLAEFFLIKLLVGRADAHYLKSLDPILYRNLLYLRDYEGDVQDLGLDFTTVTNNLGQTKIVELKPNGQNIPVTNFNRLEYIHRLANLKLNVQIKLQLADFREGLNSVVPISWLRLFNHHEIQVIIGGDMQELDLQDMKNHTIYGGEFTSDHPTILLFWKILEEFSDAQKKQLLKFVTSCSRPPLLGFRELIPQFCIQSSGTEDRMPTASTCLNLLKIPIIKEESILRNKLLAAIEQQAGFELS